MGRELNEEDSDTYLFIFFNEPLLEKDETEQSNSLAIHSY